MQLSENWREWPVPAKVRLLERLRERKTPSKIDIMGWPARHVIGPDEATPQPFHLGQQWAFDSERRVTAMLAGTQSGKTSWGPWWLKEEIEKRGQGDYLAVTATYDLFKLKMLPALQRVFVDILNIGRYWSNDRVIELRNPETGEFEAARSTDSMWGRIILRSADSSGGLESATVKAAWLDEAGQDRFTLAAWNGVKRRTALHLGRIMITTTLYNLGWVKSELIDRATDGGSVTLEVLENGAELERTDNAEADICLIQFDSITNPSYPMEAYEDARATMPEDEFEMFWRGRAAALRQLIYDVFDRVRHTCPRFPIPQGWRRYMGLDFGGVNTAAVFYAEEPGTGRLYAYREYLEGGRTAQEHARALLVDEPGRPECYGGSKSEGQWRREFAAGGLPIRGPTISDVNLGINRVYGCHKKDGIVYFDDLRRIVAEKGRYQRKKDRQGNVTSAIKDKNMFHLLDAERYVIGEIRKETAQSGDGLLADAQATLAAPSRWSTAGGTPRWRRTRR